MKFFSIPLFFALCIIWLEKNTEWRNIFASEPDTSLLVENEVIKPLGADQRLDSLGYFLVNRVSKMTDHGMVGIPAGARVLVDENSDGTVTVSYGRVQIVTTRDNLTSKSFQKNGSSKELLSTTTPAVETKQSDSLVQMPPRPPEPQTPLNDNVESSSIEDGSEKGIFIVSSFLEGGAFGTLTIGGYSQEAFLHPFVAPIGVSTGSAYHVKVKKFSDLWRSNTSSSDIRISRKRLYGSSYQLLMKVKI